MRHNGCHRFPSSNRQISTNPISSAFNGRYFSFPCAIRFPKSNRQISTSPFSSAFSGRYLSLAAPTRLSISQLKSPQVLSHLLLVVAIFPFPRAIRFPSHLLLVVAFSFFSFYIIFLLCLPLCLSVVSPPGGVCNCSPSRPF